MYHLKEKFLLIELYILTSASNAAKEPLAILVIKRLRKWPLSNSDSSSVSEPTARVFILGDRSKVRFSPKIPNKSQRLDLTEFIHLELTPVKL